MIFNIQIHNYFCFCSLQFPNLILLSQVQGNQYLLLLQVRIGSIGTASFYGGAAAARPHPHAKPGYCSPDTCSIGVCHLIHDTDMM